MSETTILTKFYDAINRNDVDATLEFFDPNVIRIEPSGHETAGTHHGPAAIVEHIKKGRGTWAEGSCNIEGFEVIGNKIVVLLHAHVRKKDSAEWMGGRFADGFIFKNGKIVHYESFWQREEALAWARS